MRIILTLLLFVIFLAVGVPGSIPAAPLLYPLFHGSIFHLAANLLGVWCVFRPERKDNMRVLLLSYAVSVAVWPLSARPLVGISNMLYCAIGLRTPAFSHPWWRQPAWITFLIVTLLMLLLPRVAAVTHIVSLAAGIALAAIARKIRR